MKKCLIVLLVSVLMACPSYGQSEKRLAERLDSLLLLTEGSDIDRILDFTYPKLFTIVPREAMLKALAESLQGEEFSTTIDSVMTVRIFPIFTAGNARFAKITHRMRMNMKFNETIDTSEADSRALLSMIREDYGEANVFFDKPANTIRIGMLSDLVAILDDYSPEWSFVNFDEKEDSELASMLFTEDVLKKLRTFQ